jgi:hypothetical protein
LTGNFATGAGGRMAKDERANAQCRIEAAAAASTMSLSVGQ